MCFSPLNRYNPVSTLVHRNAAWQFELVDDPSQTSNFLDLENELKGAKQLSVGSLISSIECERTPLVTSKSKILKKCFLSWKSLLQDPQSLLLVDALGALVTFLMTAFVLAPRWIPTGIPQSALVILAIAAGMLFLTSGTGRALSTEPRFFLFIVAVLNTAYYMATFGLCIVYYSSLTVWGWIYFPVEILVVLWLAAIELRAAGGFTRPSLEPQFKPIRKP